MPLCRFRSYGETIAERGQVEQRVELGSNHLHFFEKFTGFVRPIGLQGLFNSSLRRRKDVSVARGLSVRMGLIVGLPLAVCCIPVSVFSPTDLVSVVLGVNGSDSAANQDEGKPPP